MKQTRYSFTLMEVMVGFTIISLVLGMIFSSLYQETIIKRKMDKMEKTVMTHVVIQQFLDRIFANHISTEPKDSNSTLYTTNDPRPKLLITFDNGIDPNPLFSGATKGTLCITKEALVFTLREGETFERSVVLRNNVDHLSFEFLTNGKHGIEALSVWDANQDCSPSFVKMTLNRNEDYVFWVNQLSDGIALKTKEQGQL